jgi:hypothetical protein
MITFCSQRLKTTESYGTISVQYGHTCRGDRKYYKLMESLKGERMNIFDTRY